MLIYVYRWSNHHTFIYMLTSMYSWSNHHIFIFMLTSVYRWSNHTFLFMLTSVCRWSNHTYLFMLTSMYRWSNHQAFIFILTSAYSWWSIHTCISILTFVNRWLNHTFFNVDICVQVVRSSQCYLYGHLCTGGQSNTPLFLWLTWFYFFYLPRAQHKLPTSYTDSRKVVCGFFILSTFNLKANSHNIWVTSCITRHG